jgi:hypothetical protein
MKNETVKMYLGQAKSFLKKAAQLSVIIVAIAVGFVGRDVYEKFHAPAEKYVPVTQDLNKTSVAINEKGELIFLDKGTGDAQIFDPTVSSALFKLIAANMKYTQSEEK